MKRSFISIILILCFALCCGAQNLLPQANKKGLWGYVNEKGKYVIKPAYQSASQFTSDMACVKMNGAYGFIDKSGITVIDFEYSEITSSDNKNFYIGKKKGDAGFYVITPFIKNLAIRRYDKCSSKGEDGFYSIVLNGKFGYINPYGRLAVKAEYLEKPIFTSAGVAVSHKESGYGIIKKGFTSIVPEQYVYVRNLPNGYYLYGNTDSTFGMVTDAGEIIFPCDKYSSAKIIEEKNIIEARENDKISLLDMKGSAILAECDNYSISGDVLAFSVGQSAEKINLTSGARAITVNGKDIWTSGKALSITYDSPLVSWKDGRTLTAKFII